MSMDNLAVSHEEVPANASHRIYKAAIFPFWTNLLEVIETTGFFTPYIFRPIQGFHTYFPTMGAAAFEPETSVGDLAGKVILVTGGMSPPLRLCYNQRTTHVDELRQ
jgi:hypothetical protein